MIFRLLLLLFLSFPPFSMAADENVQPINITSNSMEVETKSNKVIFKGNVTARQKDVTITADELVAVYGEDMKELKELLATGDVRITRQGRIATAEKALLLNMEKKIILTGNPKVWEGKDVVSGDKIIYFMEGNRTIVEGGHGRVRATIHTEKEGTFANPTGKGVN